ncbi:hypothetical protein N4G70_12460 [Streptomyces sp. ASQP_92]|uniref:hypothetical protein n=1 Tax=Streptomyces sp. ASQP_92 TaxID=2979116 RepID=UPI0021C213DA|nr:hypothetical protein [Streptomyces sp. ASQP_92]MCT9089681.1 hypothetical protein [Streptomyces sp. ASQP_92]
MLDTPEAVVDALRENNGRPHGMQRTVTAEELAEAAAVFEDPAVLVTALLELMLAYEFTGEHRKSPVVFARLLKLWDTAPESFSQWEAHQIFWRFKWVTTSLLQVPEVPLVTIHGWIDQMRTRYAAAEHGMQPVAAMRYHVAAHTGVGIPDAFDLWATRPRTELSDCEACEIRHFAVHQVLAGNDTGALDTWAPVLGGGASCTEEPQMSQARALLPLLRAGRVDEARSHHLAGYRKVRGSTGMQDEVGLHLEFCALSRNEGRGLEILAENRPLFEASGAPLSHLGFLTGTEVLLARLVADGHADTAVAGPPGRNWTAGDLLTRVRSDADRIAAAFDARNGTAVVGERRRARLSQLPLIDEALPLGLRSSLPRPPVPEAAVTAAAATAAAEVPEDFVALVREARRLAAEGHPGAARLWKRVDERLADGSAVHDDRLGPADLLRAELAEQRAYLLTREDRHEASRTELARAADLFTQVGMEWHALSARTRLFAWKTVFDDAPDGDEVAGPDEEAVRAGIDEALAEAERLKSEAPLTDGADAVSEGEAAAEGDPGAERVLEYLSVLYSCAFAAYQDLRRQLPEPPVSAIERFESVTGMLHTEAERLSVPHQVAAARQFVADVAGRRGDLERAQEELRAALKDIEASGRPWRAIRPRALLAQFLVVADQAAEATQLMHQSMADAVRYGDTEFATGPAHALLGHAASHLGDRSGAVRHLSEAAARFDQDGEHNEAAELRLQLADVLADSGQQADAVAVLESVLAGETASQLEERLAAQARLTLARGLRELEEFLASAEEFLRLADTIAGWKVGPLHTMVAAETATALAMAQRAEAADAAYERAVASHADAPRPSQIVRMMCEFARLTMLFQGADGLEAALGHLARADGVLAAVPDDAEDFTPWAEAGGVHYRRARVLADADKFPEALTQAEAAIAAYDQGGEHAEAPRAEAVRMAALIEGEGLDHPKEAIARLRTAATRARNANLPEAAEILDALRHRFENRRG